MSKKTLFPGTFDPFTNGHLDIVNRGLILFDEVVVAIGVNSGKKHLFSLEKRTLFLELVFANEPRVSVVHYEGLTATFAESIGAEFILRGLRTTQDFTYEQQIAYVNEDLTDAVQSVFVMSDQKNASVSSTIVRDLITYKGTYERYIPKEVYAEINKS
ncbi:MAG: pantetheine-phosphate adenylyltransferase [Bacteroidia bacterium]|jgi:pantetheine-phosphate adenylyltransferase|nr:pantetheine-phosphate adenylyltransferase [Bacteroidia bacterium]